MLLNKKSILVHKRLYLMPLSIPKIQKKSSGDGPYNLQYTMPPNVTQLLPFKTIKKRNRRKKGGKENPPQIFPSIVNTNLF